MHVSQLGEMSNCVFALASVAALFADAERRIAILFSWLSVQFIDGARFKLTDFDFELKHNCVSNVDPVKGNVILYSIDDSKFNKTSLMYNFEETIPIQKNIKS